MNPSRRVLCTAAVAFLSWPALSCRQQEAGQAATSTLAPAEWKAALAATPRAFLLDVRLPAEFAQGHIAGARLIPHTELTARKLELPTDRSTPIFVYCKAGRRSALEEDCARGRCPGLNRLCQAP